MFKNANEVEDASNEEIKKLIGLAYNVNLSDILDAESASILDKAGDITKEAEKIAFAIRDRYNSIVEDSDDEEDEDNEDDVDEFMNEVASMLDQKYNSEYEFRPDYFWVPSNC